MDSNKQWDCPMCGEWIPYLEAHEHPCVTYELFRAPTRLSLFRQCERCQEIVPMLKMIYVRRPLGGRPYWMCRPCRP
jgi:hypothetical protein